MAMTTEDNSATGPHLAPVRLRPRLALAAMAVIAAIVVWMSVALLTDRQAQAVASQSELRLTLFAGNVMSELRRNSIVPQLLSRDALLTEALEQGDYSTSSQRLVDFRDEIGAERLLLLDRTGMAVASSDPLDIGLDHRAQPYFLGALQSNATLFSTVLDDPSKPL
ncbi:MAG: sensor histidine kinase, partial [Mangrovicoccus sp.]|nr:sensor histidine kinase [Mangrovicoccus sp.]